MRPLVAAPATVAGFAPYGWLIDAALGDTPPNRGTGPTGGTGPGRPVNGGTSRRVDGLTGLDLTAGGGAPCLAVFQARAQAPAGPWRVLERHRLGTQTFLPLRGVRMLVLVALGDAAPDEATLKAFLVGGGQGITLRAGVWHHGLIALDAGDFVVLERAAPETDCEFATLVRAVAVTLGAASAAG